MPANELIISPAAEREIKKMKRAEQVKALAALDKLSAGADNLSTEKIRSAPSYFRARIGVLRIVYYPLQRHRLVVLVIRNRKDAYKGLDALDGRLEATLNMMRDHVDQALGASSR